MSLEDDTDNAEIELRDLVTQTLEDNGILTKIRAQLRAGLYLALENDINTGYQDTYRAALKTKLGNPDIRIIFCLVREFLEYFELNFTASVFEKETFLGSSYNYENREKLVQELDIGIDTLQNAPLLLEILNIARSSFNISVRDMKFNSTTNAEINKNNSTYDIISEDKLNQSDKEYSLSESVTSEVSQHVIGVKTVPKENKDEIKLNNYQKESNIQNINSENDSYISDKEKTESVIEENPTQQSEVIVSKKISAAKEEKFETDDTYEGTSSIAEDSLISSNREQNLTDLDKSVKLNSPKNLLDLDETSKSPRLSFSPDQEKRKHDKTEKLKPMSGLTSLSDLPPLQLNKSRNSDTVLLPSLYSRDFREKSSLKELDKLLDANFDSLDNYEEDFMSSGSVDNEDTEMNNILHNIKLKKERSKSGKNDNKTSIANKNIEENLNSVSNEEDFKLSGNVDNKMKKERSRTGINDKNIKTAEENLNSVSNGIEIEGNNQESVTTISEDFDINSNVDDLLKSDSTA